MKALPVISALALAACGQPNDPHVELRKSIDEARIVRLCDDGKTIVGQDREGRYVLVQRGRASFSHNGIITAYLAPGVTPETICPASTERPK